MLAQSFKTAEELGLPQKHYEALLKTLVVFETGKIKHYSTLKNWEDSTALKNCEGSSIVFDMSIWDMYGMHHCGTACCIGGTAEILFEVIFDAFDEFGREYSELNELFFPDIETCYNEITVDQAGQALRNYLTSGNANWSAILDE